ncbi:hypothetical protein BAUCODRAFT_35823 [Baudoinia panamericana UAMH 10762]|uniref:Uncharacterized protein n=1 Tax=Baudoinia panamericana (strain UAMH 10762) TaxID=717646 RepID=M2LK31_BAUPA|nr:uncharacterized protein BAUCODRAFT_35823 [Baudoinia panamericana UAMH 10762]EMC94592.1 hypothetical protein BAUCODRAFT_35823 [Baudoinia panamericana UAMH 10762]
MTAGMSGEQEATEVLLYGFGTDLQWAAIDFFERVSGGVVLEDYDRTAPGQLRSYDPTHAYGRATLQRSLSKAALRKKNRYAGGEHWIKVTFSSREAAELACARSPHIIKGHLIYAEAYQGRGPARDEAIPATQAGAQIVSGALPQTFSTNGASPNSSQTATSATMTAQDGGDGESRDPPRLHPSSSTSSSGSTGAQLTVPSQQLQRRGAGTGTLRIPGAQVAMLLPAEQALMPKQPRQSWATWVGASELIGTTVPRKDDGTFDLEKASLYWRLFYWIDKLVGTDFCGLRGDE